MPPDHRVVTLVLAADDGTARGALPTFEVELPYWQEAADVIQAARELFGIDITVVRLLEAARPRPPGGAVTYLVELSSPTHGAAPVLPLRPWSGRLAEDPHRMAWAAVGGPDAEVAWAVDRLRELNRETAGPPRQQRTWNLSSLWRIPLDDGDVWLKSVPPFFAHEGRVLDLLRGEAVPDVLAFDDRRVLVEDIPGADLYEATARQRERLLDMLVDLQTRYADRVDALLDAGLTDFRSDALTSDIESVVARTAGELGSSDLESLRRFVEGLPERYARIAACGIPDTLVHGDFHPGNARGRGDDLTLLDWGDCGVGHPLFDEPAFLDRVPDSDRGRVRKGWHRRWESAVPGSNPARAAALLEPIAAARQATLYRRFLDSIEVSEQPYHRDDPREWLQRAADLLRRNPMD